VAVATEVVHHENPVHRCRCRGRGLGRSHGGGVGLDEREGVKSLTPLSLWKKKLANLDHRLANRLLHTQIDNKRRGGVEHGGERLDLGCLLSARGWRGEGSGASARVWAAFYRPEGEEERGQEQALGGPMVQRGVEPFWKRKWRCHARRGTGGMGRGARRPRGAGRVKRRH
jgi:hypothetical protein